MITGRIYKIVSGKTEAVYVGCTQQELRYRFRDHKKSYKHWLKTGNGEVSVYPYFKEFGVENFKILLIEDGEFENITELKKRETHFIKNINCVNKVKSFRSEEEKKEYYKNYEKTDKRIEYNKSSKRKEQNRLYREKNKQTINEKSKIHYEKNKETINEKKKIHYENNKEAILEKMKEKYTCEICNSIVRHSGKARHECTQKHKNALAQKN